MFWAGPELTELEEILFAGIKRDTMTANICAGVLCCDFESSISKESK